MRAVMLVRSCSCGVPLGTSCAIMDTTLTVSSAMRTTAAVECLPSQNKHRFCDAFSPLPAEPFTPRVFFQHELFLELCISRHRIGRRLIDFVVSLDKNTPCRPDVTKFPHGPDWPLVQPVCAHVHLVHSHRHDSYAVCRTPAGLCVCRLPLSLSAALSLHLLTTSSRYCCGVQVTVFRPPAPSVFVSTLRGHQPSVLLISAREVHLPWNHHLI